MLYLLCYLLLASLAGFIMMGIDKRRAVRGGWRIPEALLFGISIIGGSLGCWIGMYVFRHKTKHWYFVLFIPLILILQVALVMYLTITGVLR